jgi:serine/threonine protein kinase
MGTVWLAEQASPVRRPVAIKFVKVGQQHSRMRARFEAERQALAIMDHPNIAKVFDGGQTSDGSPYLVMELVDGTPLSQYCDEHRLTLRQRLNLLVAVCRAVQHAHFKGIIHRDLKPSNVLVSVVDGEPTPKVIDFGLAKALDQGLRLAEQSTYTEIGQIVGSYQYMSPEQASLSGTDIDARTDVYSLGVILYELLTGTTPVTRSELRDVPLVDLLQTIRTREIARPSNRLASLVPSELSRIAQCRNAEPRSLQVSLRSELDWIALKSLEPVRENRYDTANDLANDIQRYLDGDVVTARPPSMKYRLQKTLQRNKALVLAASSVIAVLLIGVVSTLWMLVEARRARNDANERAEKLVVSQQETETAWRSSLISEAGLLAKLRDTLGWSWRAVDKLKQASDLKPTGEQVIEMRSQHLDCSLGLDARLVETLNSGKDWIRLRFSPNGQWLFTAERKDNVEVSIYIYDTSTWELKKKLVLKDNTLEFWGRILSAKESQEGISAMEISPDGRWLVVGTRQGRVHLWDAQNDFRKFDQWDTPKRETVRFLHFSSSGALLLVQCGDQKKLSLHAKRWTGSVWQAIERQLPQPSQEITTYNPGKVSCSEDVRKRLWFDEASFEMCEPGIYLDGHVPLNSSFLFAKYENGNLSLMDQVTQGRQSLTLPRLDLHSGELALSANADLSLYAWSSSASIVTVMQSRNGKTESLAWPTIGRIVPKLATSPTDPTLIVSTTADSVEVYQIQPNPEYVSRLELLGSTDVIDVRLTQDALWTLGVQDISSKTHYQIRCYDRQTAKLIQCTNILPAGKILDAPNSRVRFTEYGNVAVLLINCGWFEFNRDKPCVLKYSPVDKQPSQVTELRYGVSVTTVTLDQSYLPEQLTTALTLHPLPDERGATNESMFFSSHRYPEGRSGEVVKMHDTQTLEPLGVWENKVADIITGKALFAQADVLGDSLVISCEDGFVRQFDRQANVVGGIKATNVMMRSIDCRAGKFLAGALDGTVISGSKLEKSEVQSWIPVKDEVTAVGLLEDNLCIIGTRHSGASLWKLSDTPQLILRIPTAGLVVKRICTDPSGQSFAILYERNNVVHVWSIPRTREALAGHGLGW